MKILSCWNGNLIIEVGISEKVFLQYANLQYANIQDADFQDADFQDAVIFPGWKITKKFAGKTSGQPARREQK